MPEAAVLFTLNVIFANTPPFSICILPCDASLNRNCIFPSDLLLLKFANGSGTISPASTFFNSNAFESYTSLKSQLLIPNGGTFLNSIGTTTSSPIAAFIFPISTFIQYIGVTVGVPFIVGVAVGVAVGVIVEESAGVLVGLTVTFPIFIIPFSNIGLIDVNLPFKLPENFP